MKFFLGFNGVFSWIYLDEKINDISGKSSPNGINYVKKMLIQPDFIV
jgi:hypothetical protein